MEGFGNHYRHEIFTDEKRESFRERNFPRIVAQHIMEHAGDDLSEAGFEEGEIREFERVLAHMEDGSLQTMLSVPAQLRGRLYASYVDKVHSREMTIEQMVGDITEKNAKHNFTLGYHLSPREIDPDKDGNWTIRGTEPDHRNQDIPMAYYSLDYRNRYREKSSRYLYVVRAELRDQSGHYRDNDGTWGRAPSLSVIDCFDMPTLEHEMDQLMKEQQENGKGEAHESVSPRSGVVEDASSLG